MPSIGDPFPSGGIIMWSGTLANIPSGWFLCDGANGTPDLRSKMVPCVAAATNPGAVSGAGYVGAHTHTIDSHLHTVGVKNPSDATIQTTAEAEAGNKNTGSTVATMQSAGSATFYALAYIMKS